MASPGRPLKPKHLRRNRTPPSRGEWVDLAPLEKPVLPPENRAWSANARRAWRAWSKDPVTTQWGPADVQFARELCRLYDKLTPGEQRLRMDGLGLTPKGKRDLRWRTPAEAATIAAQAPPVRRLHAVMEQPPVEMDPATRQDWGLLPPDQAVE